MQIALKRREGKGKEEKEKYPCECRVPENSKERLFFNEQCKVEENNRMGKTSDFFMKTGERESFMQIWAQ